MITMIFSAYSSISTRYEVLEVKMSDIQFSEMIGRDGGGTIYKTTFFGASIAAKVIPAQGVTPASISELQAFR